MRAFLQFYKHRAKLPWLKQPDSNPRLQRRAWRHSVGVGLQFISHNMPVIVGRLTSLPTWTCHLATCRQLPTCKYAGIGRQVHACIHVQDCSGKAAADKLACLASALSLLHAPA